MTSRAEACPNIALEAMVYSKKIISTDNDPMPEFFQKSATYYKAFDSADLTKQIRKVMSYSKVEEDFFKTHAIKSLDRFSWDTCASKTVEYLEKILISQNKT